MYELKLLDLKKNTIFIKEFNNYGSVVIFIRKLEHSKKLKLLSFTDNSYMYD